VLPIRTILHPTDFSERSEAAFRLACSLARDHGARVILLHVLPPPMATYVGGVMTPEPGGYDKECWDRLGRIQPDDPQVPVERLLAEGSPAEAILRAAGETQCDLLVLGTHGRTGLARALMGSVAEAVVRKAPCPVLTVKVPYHTEPDPQHAPGSAPPQSPTQ
jgi:nucleotide-binding universal stress UspA family protein